MLQDISTKLPDHIRAILFDLDGVIIESYKVWYHLFNDALEHFGFPRINHKTFQQHWGESTEQDVRIFMPGTSVDMVRAYFVKNYQKYISHLKINRNGIKVLKKLQGTNLQIGCVTNSHRDIVEKVMQSYGLSVYFRVVMTADDVVHPKPYPDMLYQACDTLGVSPSETMFIGDTPIDIKAGKNAGCVVIGYRTAAPVMIQDLGDLLMILL